MDYVDIILSLFFVRDQDYTRQIHNREVQSDRSRYFDLQQVSRKRWTKSDLSETTHTHQLASIASANIFGSGLIEHKRVKHTTMVSVQKFSCERDDMQYK